MPGPAKLPDLLQGEGDLGLKMLQSLRHALSNGRLQARFLCDRLPEDRRPQFENVRWSSADALQRTVAAARNCGLRTHLGPSWWDVDSPHDLDVDCHGRFAETHSEYLADLTLQSLNTFQSLNGNPAPPLMRRLSSQVNLPLLRIRSARWGERSMNTRSTRLSTNAVTTSSVFEPYRNGSTRG